MLGASSTCIFSMFAMIILNMNWISIYTQVPPFFYIARYTPPNPTIVSDNAERKNIKCKSNYEGE